jgi:hypothetical protein
MVRTGCALLPLRYTQHGAHRSSACIAVTAMGGAARLVLEAGVSLSAPPVECTRTTCLPLRTRHIGRINGSVRGVHALALCCKAEKRAEQFSR